MNSSFFCWCWIFCSHCRCCCLFNFALNSDWEIWIPDSEKELKWRRQKNEKIYEWNHYGNAKCLANSELLLKCRPSQTHKITAAAAALEAIQGTCVCWFGPFGPLQAPSLMVPASIWLTSSRFATAVFRLLQTTVDRLQPFNSSLPFVVLAIFLSLRSVCICIDFLLLHIPAFCH